MVKDVIYQVADTWEQISADSLQKQWRKLFKLKEKGNEDKQVDNGNEEFTGLIQLPGCGNSNESIVQECFNEDEQYQITDSSLFWIWCTQIVMRSTGVIKRKVRVEA